MLYMSTICRDAKYKLPDIQLIIHRIVPLTGFIEGYLATSSSTAYCNLQILIGALVL
jgi:hypothetical protein